MNPKSHCKTEKGRNYGKKFPIEPSKTEKYSRLKTKHAIIFVFILTIFIVLTCQTSQTKSPFSDLKVTEVEADRLWEQKCTACHGVDGTPNESLPTKPRKLRGFGLKMGFLFGGDKMREGIYKTIRDGKNQTMPSFKEELSEAEIRALVKRIERF
ncbi:c-type cytochrome [Leptospira kmetyi]|uniref:c-type cytochrome n=1 Tax=Leptospira kmetyi TaxID=408139 RepID=UPI001082CA7E|nr:cytochrome c [Leptospira kmetyi]TGK15947.1 cytochrome c [Leptospira kmetyi]TGK31977.1 cytochrome c [Leptospira kmetyi]